MMVICFEVIDCVNFRVLMFSRMVCFGVFGVDSILWICSGVDGFCVLNKIKLVKVLSVLMLSIWRMG